MRVNVIFNQETFEYWQEYDLSVAADVLLSIYDITAIPEMPAVQRDFSRKIDIYDEVYVDLIEKRGARSKKLSISRLFQFGYECDVLSSDEFRCAYYRMLPAAAEDDEFCRRIVRLKKAIGDVCEMRPKEKELAEIQEKFNEYLNKTDFECNNKDRDNTKE